MSKLKKDYKIYLEDVRDDNLHLEIDDQYEPLSFEEYVYNEICELNKCGFSIKNEFELNYLLEKKENINKINEENLEVVKSVGNLDNKLFGFKDNIKSAEVEDEYDVLIKEHLDNSKEILVKVYKLKVNIEKIILENSSLKLKRGHKINVYKLSYQTGRDDREEYRFVIFSNKSDCKVTSKNLIDTHYDGLKIIGDTESLMDVIYGEKNIENYLQAIQLFNEIRFIQIGSKYEYANDFKNMPKSYYIEPKIYKLNGEFMFRYIILDDSEIEDVRRVYVETIIFNKFDFKIKIFRDFTNLIFLDYKY